MFVFRQRYGKKRVVRLSAAEVRSRSGRSKEVQGPDRARLADRLSEANRYIGIHVLVSIASGGFQATYDSPSSSSASNTRTFTSSLHTTGLRLTISLRTKL
jgi:hypothetical protein